jgi:MFS family permease
VFIPKYTVGEFGVTVAIASFMLVPLVIATAIGSPVFGRMIDKIGSKWVILLGLLLPAIGFLVLALSSHSLVWFYITGMLIGLGLSILSGSSLRYIMLNEVTSEHRASTQGIVTIFVSIGQLLGGAVIGVLIATEGGSLGYKYLFLMLTLILLILFFLSFGLKNRKQELETAMRH